MSLHDGKLNKQSGESQIDIFVSYYSDAILGCLHRNLAIQEWSNLQNRGTVSMERVLSAYDMFVLHDRPGDFDEVYIIPHFLIIQLAYSS